MFFFSRCAHRRKLRHKSGGMASAELEAIAGVWGRSPQRGPGAEPLVRGPGDEAPLKLKSSRLSQVQMGRKFANFLPYKLLKYVFWATVCKTVRPMLLDRCLSVCPVCDVCVLWPKWLDGSTLGMEVGFRPGHIVLDGDL